MPLGVLEHQRQLRDQVLEVVHDERGHPVERVELARFEQRLGRADLAEIARRLPARGLQQIADLPVDVDRRPRRHQHDEAQQLAARHRAE